MKIRMHLVAVVLFLVVANTGIGEAPLEILQVGLWHGTEVTAEAGPDWWGVFPEGDGFTLQVAPVTITLAHDGILDDVGEMTGKQVSVPQEAEPVMLVRGLKDPEQGHLNTLNPMPSYRFLHPGESISLALPKVQQPEYLRLVALGEAKERPDFPDVMLYNYQVRLYLGSGPDTRTQTLATVPELGGDGRPRLRWAGDLDRDGKIDLLYDLTDHYNVTHLALFLSSAAPEGALVGKVAEWVTTGC